MTMPGSQQLQAMRMLGSSLTRLDLSPWFGINVECQTSTLYVLFITTDNVFISLPGPPLTNDTTLSRLLDHGVIVGLGVRTAWEARNTRFDVQWVSFPLGH